MHQVKMLIVIVLSCAFVLINGEKVVVDTPLGEIVGVVADNVPVVTFKGIRYAEAPVDDLRFRLPSSPFRWNGTLNATKRGPACYQEAVATTFFEQVVEQSEDCLFLDIFVDGKNISSQNKMPVMIYIHGGGFIIGFNSLYRKDGFVAGRGIIAVTIQYRLGLLGFAQSPDDEKIPGNIGLHDQIAAIKWVKKYIGAFGGDSESITLAGESAGSIAVLYHLLSPLSTGLFNRVIMQSGTHETVALMTDQQRDKVMNLLINSTKCDEDILDPYECLRRMPIKKLRYNLAMVRLENDRDLASNEMSLTPTLDRRFFDNRHPSKSVADSNYTTKLDSVLIGHNGNEGAVFLAFTGPSVFPILDDTSDDYRTREEMEAIVPKVPAKHRKQYRTLIDIAFDDRCRMNTRKLFNKMGKVQGDSLFGCSQIKLAQSLAKFNPNGSVYYYHYLYRTENPLLLPYVSEALHAEELPFVYGKIIDSDDFTPAESDFSKRLVRDWTTVVSEGTVADPKWTPLKYKDGEVHFNHIAFHDPSRSDYLSGPPENFCKQLDNVSPSSLDSDSSAENDA